MKRFLWLELLLFLLVICLGCGDTFRPVIIPNPPAFPDPRASHTVMAVNDNGTGNQGSVMVVDVSGDSDVSVRDVGLAPVHAVQQTASQVLVVNHAVPGANADSLTKLIFLGTQISNTTTISLPPDSAPNFVATTESSQAYVLLPNFFDPVQNTTVPSVGVVSTTSNALVATIPLSANPLANPTAMAETPDGKKLYVAITGDSAVSGFNTIDRSARTITNGVFNSPLLVVARSDSQRVYVLDADGTLITIDTTSTSGPDTVITPGLPVGAGATNMIYDVRLNRIYVPSGSQVAVVDVSGSSPQVLGSPVSIPTVQPSARSAQDPCFSTSATTLQVVSAAALPDESRAYVGAFYEDASGNICPQVTAINTSGNTVKTSIPVPGFSGVAPFSPPICATTRFRFTMAAGGDSSRVYLASCDAGNVNIIDTATDTYLLNLPAPASSRPPIPPSNQPPPQNPVFLIAGP